MSWRPVAGITVLRDQVNKRWPKRDKRSDGVVGDLSHQARPSDHNPDKRGYVHALDIDEDFRGSKGDAMKFANELIEYARLRKPGSERLKYVVYEDKVASGTYKDKFWVWRGSGYGHTHHIHVSFTTTGETDTQPFRLPIFGFTETPAWDGKTPTVANVVRAEKTKIPSIAAWRVASRLYDLGFWSGKKPAKYAQRYPVKAVHEFQEAKGIPVGTYNDRTHKELFG